MNVLPEKYPNLSAIVAMAANGVIGRDNQLPWHLSPDLKRFKQLTSGNVVVMGRKTYASIGKPLPNRFNVIVSRSLPSEIGLIRDCPLTPQQKQTLFQRPIATVVSSLEQILEVCCLFHDKEVFIIGGNEIFDLALQSCSKLYLTEIQQSFEGDVYFSAFDKAHWHEISREQHVSEQDDLEYHFVNYIPLSEQYAS